MNVLSRLFKRKPEPEPTRSLLGLWRQVEPEPAAPVLMKFSRGGRLEYHVVELDGVGIVKLTYRVQGSNIISNQPSSPREERTRFEFVGPNELVLDYGGEETCFARVVLREYETVRIARLLKADRVINGTEGVMRQPAIGDVATICHENDPSDPSASVVVEMCDREGNTVWLADFEREELEPAMKPGVVFMHENEPVGVFSGAAPPVTDGIYRYEPYRGTGHLQMQQRLKESHASCSYSFHGAAVTFRVVACPSYGVLQLASFEIRTSMSW
jgi:hypothetical protein